MLQISGIKLFHILAAFVKLKFLKLLSHVIIFNMKLAQLHCGLGESWQDNGIFLDAIVYCSKV